MPNPLARHHVALASAFARGPADHAVDIAAEWQAHVDAGRIGNRSPMPPEIQARIVQTEALFARLAAERSQ